MQNIHIATYQDAAAKLGNVLTAAKEPVIVRLGGHKAYPEYAIQINTAQAVLNSINKLVQKNLLINGGIATLPLLEKPEYPCVIKGVKRSCGVKVFVVNSLKELNEARKVIEGDFYLEPLFNATSEYRLHCTRKEVFFAVKKFKRDPADVIINHKNHYNKRDFVKPRLWNQIQAECLKAMQVLDLDIACFDVMYSSADPNQHVFTIAEANTNPELLANTFEAYKVALQQLIQERIASLPAKKQENNLLKKLTDKQKLAVVALVMANDYAFDGEVLTIKNFQK